MARPVVLIVDDSPANLKVARVALEGEDYELVTAADGAEAWALLAKLEPDLILMDLQLPGLDGFELAKRIKADPARSRIKIIAVTAYAMKGDRERALAAGCDGYIAKPIDPILLPELVAAYLKEPHRPTETRGSPEPQAILVVEDNPTTRKMIRVALESDGHRVCEAADGRSALEWIAHEQPRLVLQDLVLPDMDGLDLLRRLRAMPHGQRVPILCLSGFLARMETANAVKDGFSALLVKPVDPIQLLEIVRVHLAAARPIPTSTSAEAGPLVLIVDDDPLQRRLAEYHLSGAGFRVTCVATAKQALAEAARLLPDAVVTDVLMPEMDGFELCFELRRRPLLAHIPVVLVSSHYVEAADRKLGEQVGASAFVERRGDWVGALSLVREAIVTNGVPPVTIGSEAAREAILRRALAQLQRQRQVNAELTQRSLLQSAQLSVLAGVADALARNTRLTDVLGDVLAVCLDLAGISKGALYLRREGELVPRQWIGFNGDEVAGLADLFGQAKLVDRHIATGQVTTIPSSSISAASADALLRRAGVQAALIVPVMWGEQIYGALLLGARSADVTGPEPAAFARVLGGQMGQAIGLADAFDRLSASERNFHALLDSMDYVTVVDRDQRVTGVYGRGARRDRIDPSAMLGKKLPDLYESLDRAAHENAHVRALAGESTVYGWASSAGANPRQFESAVFPVHDSAGHVHSVVRVTRDVTEQTQLQAQIMLSDRMASVGMLAAGVAHEINNPLMAVLGNLQLALDDFAPPAVAGTASADLNDSLKDALDAAHHVEAIVRDLRLFSRPDDERMSGSDVRTVLESTLRMARNEIRHRARLVTDFRPVPKVRGNDSRLGQVFLNLLLNAAQAIPEGHADTNEIRVSMREEPPDCVSVEIADTGSGIPPELAARLFQPFVTTKPAGVGTGLGLSICHRIVTSLGGRISFESNGKRGTVFRVVLCVDAEPSLPPKLQPPFRAARRRGSVLVIDDDLSVQALLRRILTSEHDVVCLSDAKQALERLESGPSFDVILCDLMMPVMTGGEFYDELLRTRPDDAARFVFLTGGAFTPSACAVLERTAVPCLEKPFDVTALRTLVNEKVA